MLKSIEDGEWDRIVLLPSHTTKEFAQTLQERISNPAVEINALPTSGQENNADGITFMGISRRWFPDEPFWQKIDALLDEGRNPQSCSRNLLQDKENYGILFGLGPDL